MESQSCEFFIIPIPKKSGLLCFFALYALLEIDLFFYFW